MSVLHSHVKSRCQLCVGCFETFGVMAGGNFNQVELSLSCTKLLDLDTFSKSDPFAVLYLLVYPQTDEGNKSCLKWSWLKVGRTEVIYDNLDPKVKLVMV